MTKTVPSYLEGTWRTGTGAGQSIADAVTGEAINRVSSDGLDLGAAVAFGRETGGPSLRAMTFSERAAAVKAIAVALSERKDELYELSARAGSTLADAKVDVDGGFGTALVFAGLGRRGLPDGTVLVEDDPIPLGRKGVFVGRHILTSRHGVALQINAFNFPVWGMLEKLAPALLAGVPTIVKPASPTAFITEHAVRVMIEAEVLPIGALQLVCGSVSGIFDVLGGQDSVGFTGSASTAAKLRAERAVTERSVHFTAEADSLNSSVLGPDAVPGTDEFDLFVNQVVTEMTTKAGQKCTAIRRAFVPENLVDAASEAISAELADVVVGAPGAHSVTMGALVSLAQRSDVRAQVARLSASGNLVFGDPGKVEVVGADSERGAFLSPILLQSDPDQPAPHEIEAFGPVCTLMPYADAAHVVDLVARGEGSLVASVVSRDAGFLRSVVLGIAPHHGRLLVLDRDSAPESTGHGIPMPQLVHGGPGRAGGGEEEGGLRAVFHHMHRTAVQGGPDLVAALAGQSAS